MKWTLLLPLAAVTTAFVIPDDEVANQLVIEPERPSTALQDKLPPAEQLFAGVKSKLEDIVEASKQTVDDVFSWALETGRDAHSKVITSSLDAFDPQSWLDSDLDTPEDDEDIWDSDFDSFGGGEHPPHHDPPPHHRPPPHHKRPHHGHHKSNLTVYQLISKSKYTTKLAKLINEYDDLVDLLNGTKANYTVFAPTDKAFAKIPKCAPKPSKELLKKILTYHISEEFYPAGRVLVTRTIPTLHKEAALGKEPLPQRLSTNIGFNGLTVNFYSRVVAVDIFGTNGVIHGIDSILLLPPKAAEIINFLPGEFSTLELGLVKTGLLEKINTTEHEGGTLFAPSNWAFKKLGPKINAFLFSQYGLKYLKALLEYHIVPKHTLYSDAYYSPDTEAQGHRIPKGHFHVDLPTLLEERSLSIDIGRFGRLITIKINGFSNVAVQNGIARDGVIHVVSSVIIPPKKLSGGKVAEWQGEELTEDDLKERLEPYVDEL
ncbi:FAS1 domain-containing protein [Xylona heveae TC161]|uniref:FAS1 domain-containing protein n=1 Tax=Xylona heveae (strain CBS 132557 / TC161) TaxID=1328760 RepID=A0A165FEU1_XYLHT|nr:FAS1 domain-containing protein [Xylona heveae TC161]KZF20894.1 FAS1 domain-containing protein [Xylona heveae TC161]